MTIQEVIKSGKKFKRPHMADWRYIIGNAICNNSGKPFATTEDLLATDWEIKREPMIIYVNVWGDGDLGRAYKDKDTALMMADDVPIARKFVEVIE